MARPSGAGSILGMICALFCAACNAFGTLAVRGLTRTESTASIVFYTALFMTFGSLPALPFFWRTPNLPDLALFCSIGLIGGISQYWVTQALYYAPAAAVSPFNYTALIWGSLLGFVVWDEVPGTAVVIGAAIITLSGLYLLYYEALHRRPAPKTPAAG